MNKFKVWLFHLIRKSPPTKSPSDWNNWGEVNNGRPAQVPMGVVGMTNYRLTPDQLEKLAAFKQLPDKNKSHILETVRKLEQIRLSGQVPSEEDIFQELSATGYLEIGLACYVAQLAQIKWV